jgi:hypothetical protein
MSEIPEVNDVLDYISTHEGLRERDSDELFTVILKEATDFIIKMTEGDFLYFDDEISFAILFKWDGRRISLFINKELFSTWNIRNKKLKILDL